MPETRTRRLAHAAAGAALIAALPALALAQGSATPSAPAQAQGQAQGQAQPADPAGNADPKGPSETRSPVAQLHLADRLWALAMERDDPVLAMAAARIALSVPTRPVDRTPEGGATPAPADATGQVPDAAEMARVAREMASRDPAFAALAQGLEVPEGTQTRGRVGGAGVNRAYLAPGGQHVYFGGTSRFYGQELAIVQVLGDGFADLDLYVYDEAGNLICRRDSTAASEQCSWTPRWTGTFRIVVRNAGPDGSNYVMRTN